MTVEWDFEIIIAYIWQHSDVSEHPGVPPVAVRVNLRKENQDIKLGELQNQPVVKLNEIYFMGWGGSIKKNG